MLYLNVSKKLYPHEVKLLQLYNVHAVTEGTDAQATVSVRIEEKGKTTVGQAADTDTLVASANAYLSALNKLIIKREKTAPDPSLSAQNRKGKKCLKDYQVYHHCGLKIWPLI